MHLKIPQGRVQQVLEEKDSSSSCSVDPWIHPIFELKLYSSGPQPFSAFSDSLGACDLAASQATTPFW